MRFCLLHKSRSSGKKRAQSQGPLNGGVSNGGASQSGLFCPFLSFLGLSRFFGDFPDLLGDGLGNFPICSFCLFLGLLRLRAPTRNSPERVRNTIWTFSEKSGKHPGLETPRFSFFQQRSTFWAQRLPGWGSSMRRGGDQKVRSLPRKFVFLGFRGEGAWDVPGILLPGCS